MLDFEHQLIGVFDDDRYRVGAYEIILSKIAKGHRMTVVKGDEVQEIDILDGENPDITEIKEMLNTMRDGIAGAAEAEEARAAAERLRELAENGAPGADPKTYRSGLYPLMLDLYNRLYPKIDNDLAATEAAKNAAQSAKSAAETARNQAQNAVNDLFYSSGDLIQIGPGGPSASLNASGYCTADKKQVHVKIPLAKRLDRISGATVRSFNVHVVNTGGYGVRSTYGDGGSQYAGTNIGAVSVDRVQNCLHIILTKSDGFYLTANECVSVRVGNNYGAYYSVDIQLN